jgi:hypothetical protein
MMHLLPDALHVVAEQRRAELLQLAAGIGVTVGTQPAVYALWLVVVTEPPVLLGPQLLSGICVHPLFADKFTCGVSVPPSGKLQATEQS